MKHILLFLLLFLPFWGLAQKPELPNFYVPKNLDEALFHLHLSWTEDQQMVFKRKPEDKAVAEQYFFGGLDIRNNWGLWTGSPLADYFKAQNIYHPDDMSAIILRSFHRELNRKPIELEEQLQYHREFWEFIDQQYTDNEKKIARNFNSIQVADTVEMAFFMATEASGQTSIQLMPSAGNHETDQPAGSTCKLKGVVQKKERYGKTYKLFIKLTSLCQPETVYYGNEKLQAGNILNFDLRYHNWKKSIH